MQLDIFKSFKKSPQILGQISLKMRSISCNENYCLFQKGDRAKEIYIQRTGESELDYHDGYTRKLQRGDVIGERSIISPKRKTTVICDTFSEFYILSVQDIVTILQTEYPTTWSKRWRKIVKQLKESIKRDRKKIRTVDFDKHKSDQHLLNKQNNNDTNNNNKNKTGDDQLPETNLQKRNSSQHNQKALQSWMATPSTIKTTRFTTKNSDKIKSVHLNYTGGVDTPIPSPVIIGKKLENIQENPYKQVNTNNNTKRKETYPKSDGEIIIPPNPMKQSNNSGSSTTFGGDAFMHHRSTTDHDAMPGLSKSTSQPVLMQNPKSLSSYHSRKKKGKRIIGFLARRNSLDRDNAIHRSGLYFFLLFLRCFEWKRTNKCAFEFVIVCLCSKETAYSYNTKICK